MATNFAASLTQDSDEVQEMFCEECEKYEDRYVPADGFCVDCVEYKCTDCLRYHRRHYKNHMIKDKDSMPQDFYFQKCSVHPKGLIKFYCSECDKIACEECKNNDHQNCNKVNHLPTVAKDIQQSTELKDIKENIKKISEDIILTEKQLQEKDKMIDSQEVKAKATIQKHKDELIETCRQQHRDIVDKFDRKIKETIRKLKKERQNLVEELEEKETKFKERISNAEQDITKKVENLNIEFKTLEREHLTLVNDLKKLSADLVAAQTTGQNCKLFITIKLAEKHSEKLSQKIEILKSKDIKYCIVKKKSPIRDLEGTTTVFSYEEKYESAVERTASFYSDVNNTSLNNTSLCLLSENQLLVADYFNCSLVLLTVTELEAKYHNAINMSSRPWDVTKAANNKVAVTFPDKKCIKLIRLSESKAVVNTDIPVMGECRGIAYSNNTLIVSYSWPVKCEILDISGHVIKTIEKDSNGQPLFTKPWYLAVSPSNATIYVSDWSRNTVTGLTFRGKVKAIYKDGQLARPRQLTVDETGAIYVCGGSTNNVHQLSSDLTKVKILLDGRHGMTRLESVAYCQKKNRLYIGMYTGNIKVFNLSLE